jgi:hypothetical protein
MTAVESLLVEIGDRLEKTKGMFSPPGQGPAMHCDETIMRNQLTILKALDELLRRPAGVKI